MKLLLENWKRFINEVKEMVCPKPTQDLELNTKNRMKECMPGSVQEDGQLGYCWMHHFKCHSARTCYTWAAGGPITEDDKSLEWQSKNEAS